MSAPGRPLNRGSGLTIATARNLHLISAAKPVNVPRNAGFVFHSDTCNEMFIFFPLLVGDGDHRRPCCAKSWRGRRETFSLARAAVAPLGLTPLRQRRIVSLLRRRRWDGAACLIALFELVTKRDNKHQSITEIRKGMTCLV